MFCILALKEIKLVKSVSAAGKLFQTFAILCGKNCFWELLSRCPSSALRYTCSYRSLLFLVVDSVCLSVCLSKTLLLLFCFSMESSHFLAICSPWQKLQNVVLRFLICCHRNEIWAIFAKISNGFFFFAFRWNRAIFGR